MSGNKLKVFIACEDINFNKSSGGLVNTKIISRLAQDPSLEISLLTLGTLPEGFDRVFSGHHQHEIPELSGFWRLLSAIPGLRGLPERFSGISHAMVGRYLLWKRLLGEKMAAEHFDVVLVLSAGMGWYVHLAMGRIPRRKERRIYVFHDPYPMALLPPIQPNAWVRSQRILLRKMNQVVQDADAVWLPSQRLVEWMAPHYPQLASRATIIPHLAVIPKVLAPEQGSCPMPEWHSSQRFCLLHLGSLLKGRSPKGYLQAVQQWLLQRPEAAAHTSIVFIGFVPLTYLPLFDDLKDHPNVVLKLGSRISYRDALSLQQAVAVNVVIESETADSPQLLGKMADNVWANRPLLVLGNARSEARRILGETYPFQADNDDVAGIIQAINQLYDNWQSNREQTLNRPDLQAYMSGDNMLAAIHEIVGR